MMLDKDRVIEGPLTIQRPTLGSRTLDRFSQALFEGSMIHRGGRSLETRPLVSRGQVMAEMGVASADDVCQAVCDQLSRCAGRYKAGFSQKDTTTKHES